MAADECFSDVDVIVFGSEFGRSALQVEAVHDARKLLPNVVGRFQRAVIDKVFVTPLKENRKNIISNQSNVNYC